MFGKYNKISTIIAAIAFTLLTLFVAGFGLPQGAFFVGITAILLIYMTMIRKSEDKSSFSILGLIPGHYLLIFAVGLQSSISWINISLWGILILGSLLFESSIISNRNSNWMLLTSTILYCIIWGVVFYLVHSLLINGLSNEALSDQMITILVGTLGSIYVLVGIYRIFHEYKDERRSTI